MDGQVRETIGELNRLLSDVTPYKLEVVDPRGLLAAPENAHYMGKATFDNLVENVQRDGNLSSVPFCWRDQEGKLHILSGHHRVEAAVAAERPAILVMYDDRPLSEQQRIAIQLSHNALVGRDNPEILLRLWERIDDVALKFYSGLDENTLRPAEPPELRTLSDRGLRFEHIAITFISSEVEQAEATLKALKSVGDRRWLADAADFDRFFQLLLDFKEATDIVNTATAFKLLIEIGEAWLQQNAQQQEADEPGPQEAQG